MNRTSVITHTDRVSGRSSNAAPSAVKILCAASGASGGGSGDPRAQHEHPLIVGARDECREPR